MSNESPGGGASAPLPDPIAYREIAQEFFQQFLELSDRIRAGADPLTLERELQAERRRTNEQKRLLSELAGRNEALELAIEDMERQAEAMRKSLNEALFEVARLQELQTGRVHAPGAGVPFVDRLSDRSKREMEKLMKQRPSSNPNRREERE